MLISSITVYSQTAGVKLMPVTTNSKSALSAYNEAKKYLDAANFEKALETFKKALDQDPDFFMANYQLALFFLLNESAENFVGFADAAIKCKANLSDAEELLKDALTRLSHGQINVTDDGKKLVELYPKDAEAYSNLINFLSLADDTSEMVETLNKAIKIASYPAPFYNQLGYTYLMLKQSDKAEAAFDKYMELEPHNPNAYDSKGDYFMYIKKYDKAYESYMKAHSLNPAFSGDKAEAAKQLYEQSTGNKLNITTT